MLTVTSEYLTEVSAPSVEPVTTAEAKTHCRVDHSDDDDAMAAMVTAARQYVELYTGRYYVQRTLRADLPYFYTEILLPGPVVSISSVKYYDTESPSTLQTLAATNYALLRNVLVKSYGATYPDVYPRGDAVQITFLAGHAPTGSPEDYRASVPGPIKQAVLLMVGDMYENRESNVVGTSVVVNPTVDRLLQGYRVFR